MKADVPDDKPQNDDTQIETQENKPQNNNIQTEPKENEELSDNIVQEQDMRLNEPKDNSFDIAQSDVLSSDISDIPEDSSNFDDITLLSESFEAQEKLREYVMSELSKNNMDVSSQKQLNNNEFKLDISERTLNMIARTMAKKIAKYVGSIMAADAKQSSKAVRFEEENKRLIQKTRELEEQNRKLRLLLAESNKNLNSYKPSIFGLYKKVTPKKTNR